KPYFFRPKVQLVLVVVAPDYAIAQQPSVFGQRLSPHLDYLVVRSHDRRSKQTVISPDVLQKRLQHGRDVLSAIVNLAMAAGMPSRQVRGLFRETAYANKSRLLASMTFDATSFSIVGNHTRPGKPGPVTQEAGTMAYFEVCALVQNGTWRRTPSTSFGNPMAVRDADGVVYEDAESAQHKADVVRNASLGGVMLWDVTSDDYRGDCGTVNPIARVVMDTLKA
ncbi:unnamed protein product, partial [Ixodes hexagonus]